MIMCFCNVTFVLNCHFSTARINGKPDKRYSDKLRFTVQRSSFIREYSDSCEQPLLNGKTSKCLTKEPLKTTIDYINDGMSSLNKARNDLLQSIFKVALEFLHLVSCYFDIFAEILFGFVPMAR